MLGRCAYGYKERYGRAGDFSISAFNASIAASSPFAQPCYLTMAYQFSGFSYASTWALPIDFSTSSSEELALLSPACPGTWDFSDVSHSFVRVFPCCIDLAAMDQASPVNEGPSAEAEAILNEILGDLAYSFDGAGELDIVVLSNSQCSWSLYVPSRCRFASRLRMGTGSGSGSRPPLHFTL